MRSNPCPKCGSSMAEGYVLAERQSLPALQGWTRGKPTKGWFGVKRATEKPIEISTWRCQRCGFLEHYALK